MKETLTYSEISALVEFSIGHQWGVILVSSDNKYEVLFATGEIFCYQVVHENQEEIIMECEICKVKK